MSWGKQTREGQQYLLVAYLQALHRLLDAALHPETYRLLAQEAPGNHLVCVPTVVALWEATFGFLLHTFASHVSSQRRRPVDRLLEDFVRTDWVLHPVLFRVSVGGAVGVIV